MGETIFTFEQLIKICSSNTSFYMSVRRFKELTAMIMSKKNFEFEQWFRLSMVLTPSGDPFSEIQNFVFRKMEKCGTFKQWFRARKTSKPNSKTSELTMRKMVEKAKTFQQWLEVYKNANAAEYYLYSPPEYDIHDDFELVKLAVSKMLEKDGTFEQWFEVYSHHSPHRKSVQELAVSKMLEKDGTFEQWLKVLKFGGTCGSENPEKLAFNKMLEKDGTFEQWLKLSKWLDLDNKHFKLSMGKVLEKASTFEQWLRVFNCSTLHHNLAINKLSKMSPTIKQWRAFLQVLKQ